MPRRNDLDICVDILKVAKGGAKKTHIVYKANLNFNIVEKYLIRLIDGDLPRAKDRMFFTTTRGRQFLEEYSVLVTPLSEVEPMEDVNR